MRDTTTRRAGLLPVLLSLGLAAWTPGAPAAERGPVLRATVADSDSTARVIVKFRSGSTLVQAQSASRNAGPQQAQALGARLGLSLSDGHPLGERTQALRGSGLGSAALAAQLAAQSDVEWAVVDGRRYATATTPNDPYLAGGQTSITPAVGQWYLRAYDSTLVSAVNAVGAWATTIGSASITVAVLDTGVRFDHPDFFKADGSSKLYAGYDFVSDTSTSHDGNGRDADPSDPGDYTSAEASSWHGTQVAGIVGAATDNGIGMASVGREVMVLPVRVLGAGGGTDSDIIAAMLWAGGLSSSPTTNPHPAQVINLSLGATGSCPASYLDAISRLNAAGVVVVVAAGNSNGLAVNTPANCSGAIAVGGLRHTGTKVGYSSLGPQVAVSAPAGNCVNETGACLYPILTTTNAGTTAPGANTYSDSSDSSLGTSFSAPIVAGTVGLMLSANPALTPAEVASLLKKTARSFPTTGAASGVASCHAPTSAAQNECYCSTSTCGAGMLDSGAAVAAAAAANAAALPTAAVTAATSTPTVGAAVTLSAAGSASNSGGSITGYAWSITSGAGLASFTSATNGSSATLATSGTGSVVVSLTVTDSSGTTATATQSLLVVAAPTASIGAASTTPTVGDSLTLTATASAGTGRSITAYAWRLSSGAGLATLGNASSATATLATSAAGTVVVTLTVTDSAGATATASQSLTVGAGAVTVSATAGSSSNGGSGGGALGLGWLLGLALAVAGLAGAGHARRPPSQPVTPGRVGRWP